MGAVLKRASASARGYGRRWQRARAAYLSANPLCVRCNHGGKLVTATVVDHVTPHRGDWSLFWQQGNWQALCKPCHDRKTASEDGGYRQVTRHGVGIDGMPTNPEHHWCG